jgi:hypothetical protein
MDAGLGWRQIKLRADPPMNPFVDVIAHEGMLYAAGSVGDGPVAPLVVSSPDGITWTREAISSAFGRPSALYALGGRLLALGAGETSNCAHPFAIDTWARAADATWTEAPWKEALCAGREWAGLLDRAGTVALVGVGSGGQPLSWSSNDGLTWRDLRPAVDDVSPRAAVVDGDAILGFGAGPDDRARAIRSVDGRRFDAAPFPVLPPEANVIAALWRGPALDVFLGDGPHLGLATRDASGVWSTSPATGIRADQIGRILAVGDRVVALGTDESGRQLAWSSDDGVSWIAVPMPNAGPDTSVSGIARIGDLAVLVGGADTPDGSRTVGAIWIGSAELLGG